MFNLNGISKSFGTKSLFQGVSYRFPVGERIALVGANGVGKTTMLRIIAGEIPADDGEITTPQNFKFGHLPQEPNPNPKATTVLECMTGAREVMRLHLTLEKAMAELDDSEASALRYAEAEEAYRLHGGYALEAKAIEILSGLGFSEKMLQQCPTELSGGWRMRVELAKLFIDDPDFLILDEPTNHLDLPSLMWVEKYLKQFRGTVLFVSHDRALLNRLSTKTLHLQGQSMTAYAGNFDAFLQQFELRLEQSRAELANLQRRRGELQRFVDRFGAKASKATQAQSRVKMIDRIKALEEGIEIPQEDSKVGFKIPVGKRSPRELVSIADGAIGYDQPLAKNLELKIERGMKVAIIGANGIGKSTLLKTIIGYQAALTGTFKVSTGVDLAYFAQDQLGTLDPERTVLENLLDVDSELGEGGARGLLGQFLFRGDDVFKKVKVLSGGEKSRVGLACVLAKSANFLVLDEPTNHLDMSSVEALIQALEAYQGTSIFVSHDRDFIDRVCTHVFAMVGDGRCAIFEGKLADYQRLAKVSGFPNVLALNETENASTKNKVESQKATTKNAQKQKRHQSQKQQKALAKLEKSMERLKASLAEKNLSLNNAGSDFALAASIQTEIEAEQLELEKLEEQWLELSES